MDVVDDDDDEDNDVYVYVADCIDPDALDGLDSDINVADSLAPTEENDEEEAGRSEDKHVEAGWLLCPTRMWRRNGPKTRCGSRCTSFR